MFKKIPDIFLRPFPYWKKIDLFRKVLYVFLLLNALSLLPIAEEVFGYHGIVGTSGWDTSQPWYLQGSKGLVNLLSHPINHTYSWLFWCFVFGQIGVLICGLFNIWPKLMSVAVYFFTINLFIKGYLMFTGGEALVGILLFYLMFIQESDPKTRKKTGEPVFTDLQNVLNNTFYWIMLIQICVLYFFSTLYKLIDPYWLSGDAMQYISRIDAFSSGGLRYLFADNPTLSAIATYFTLIYQGLFPVLVWFKKIKLPFLLLGVLFHLGIAFGMGIFTFGIIMILTYLLFLEDNQIEKIKTVFKRNLRSKAFNTN